MARAFSKELTRSITRSLGRFLAIVAISALGTGFYAGLQMTKPDMLLSADTFYDSTELMDIRVASTLGMTEADGEAIAGVEGVESVMLAKQTDIVGTINAEQYAMRVHSLSDSAASSDTSDGVHAVSDDAGYLNRPILASGRWPEAPDECVISADRVMNAPTELGDVVEVDECLSDIDDTLTTRKFTIVGTVHAPYYVAATALGTTSLGGGTVQQFMYVLDGAFDADLPYAEAFVTVSGAKDQMTSTDAYQEVIDPVKERLEAVAPERAAARTDEVRAEAREKIDDAWKKYRKNRKKALGKLDDAEAELSDAYDTLTSSEAELEDARTQYADGERTLAEQKAEAKEKLAAAQAQIDESEAQLTEAKTALNAGEQQLAAAWAQAGMTYDQAVSQKETLEGQLEQAKAAREQMAQMHLPTDQIDAQISALETGISQLNQLIGSQDEYDAQKTAYNGGVAQLEAGKAALAKQKATAKQKLAEAGEQLKAAEKQIEEGEAKLADGWASYYEGKAEFDEKKADALAKLAKAERKIKRNERKIDDIEEAEWFVLDRTKNYGVESFKSDASRIGNIAAVFPFIFFLVAALVSLTTMTRMVEEERMLIGTFKALGYSRARITSKYLLYAGIASGVGSVLGILVLCKVLPWVIQFAYAIIYFVPPGPYPVNIPIACLATLLGMSVTLGATWAAVAATLREKPAALLLPRVPKAGKRILMERITPLWKRLSFSRKVTWRNIFRYKKRFIMTVVGIAGCTALLLTGLGLHDSIGDIIDKQFGVIIKYQATVNTDDDIDPEDKAELQTLLDDPKYVQKSTWAGETTLLAEREGRASFQAAVVVPENVAAFSELMVLKERTTQNPLGITDAGAIITEKLAYETGTKVGDTLTLTEQDDMGNVTDVHRQIPVVGISENYTYHYVYLTPATYESIWGEPGQFTRAYVQSTDDEALRAEFSEKARAIDGVRTVAFNDETIDAYRKMIQSVNMVVVVLVLAAAALAFIVLYNLTNINITERVREIATLKVLGFTPGEVQAYIFRETIILSIVGSLAGLILGVFMEGFVVATAEVDQVMFGRAIHPESFIISVALTLVFTVVVMFAMRGKLRKINMVESLKSVE